MPTFLRIKGIRDDEIRVYRNCDPTRRPWVRWLSLRRPNLMRVLQSMPARFRGRPAASKIRPLQLFGQLSLVLSQQQDIARFIMCACEKRRLVGGKRRSVSGEGTLSSSLCSQDTRGPDPPDWRASTGNSAPKPLFRNAVRNGLHCVTCTHASLLCSRARSSNLTTTHNPGRSAKPLTANALAFETPPSPPVQRLN